MKTQCNKDEKDQIVDSVCDALENDGTAIVFIDTKGEGIHFVQGTPLGLITLIVHGMTKHKNIKFIFEKAVSFVLKVLDKRGNKTDQTPNFDDIFDHSPLDCEKCPMKGECPIEDKRDELLDLISPTDFKEMMEKMLINKRKN